ncbi:hypothetical protein ILUMI_22112 [Ignelater luminosus]|uniref:Uncharacterized protein n=1 Tax=Ignelater luminosus TaxID=2038154 RepID=A0A8K0CHQ2_IGNLU|nr:hypothetical protein ILUMI_22112 [Ignelater luminosus]
MWKFFLLHLCFVLSNTYDLEPHKMETTVERFRFGDYDFIFYSKDANWAEAYTICKATHSRLAVVNTLDRARFLADALTQTKVVFEDVWIGGRFSSDRWRWASTGKTFSRLTKDYPPWLNYPTQRGKNCLSLDRRNHRDPIFVEKKCTILRGFVCEESVVRSLDTVPEAGNEIKINNSQYFLYHARVTWEEALAFCKQTESRLAIIPDLGTAKALVSLMRKSRPAFENAWIGARRYYMDWLWVPTEQELLNETGSGGYPPWRFDRPIDEMKSCVILDHHPCHLLLHVQSLRQHQCEEPWFIEEECNLKKDFICESASETNVEQVRQYQITVDQITYIFFSEQKTWEEALIVCENFSMTLATPETDRQWELIITYMGDMQREFDHIWLGGRWFPNEWAWLNNRSIPLPSNKTYPPWCTSYEIHEDDQDCLNLDRDAHAAAVIYGYDCSIPQQFVCQFDNADAIELPDVTKSNEYKYKANMKRTHFEAEYECKQNDSFLAIVSDMKSAQELAVLLPRDTLVWIGGKRIGNVWRWTRTRQIIPDIIAEDSYPPWESFASTIGQRMCLAMKSGYREQPFFVERPCGDTLDYVCQAEDKDLPSPDIIMDYNGIKHFFYNKEVSWFEAVDICHSGNLFLVNVGNLGLAKFLLQGMGDNHSQWTSGKETLPGSWSWITTGLKVPSQIKRGYPPWLNDTVPLNSAPECLLLKDVKENPAFTSENCTEKHSFVCIDKIFVVNETEIDVGNVTISIQDMITSISKAKQSCIDNGKSVIDFTKMNETQLLDIFKMEKVKSVWVDVIYNEKGKWVHADTDEEFRTKLDFPDRDTHPINDPKSCLTLHLTPEEKLVLWPSLCSDFSRIVCMTNETKKPVPTKFEKVINDSASLIAFLDNTAIYDSNLRCNDIGGEIVNRLMSNSAIEFFKTLPPEYERFWLGAKFINQSWRWSDGTNVTLKGLPQPTEIKYPNETSVYETTCLIYSTEIDGLESVDCAEKYSTVCEKIVLKCQPRTIPRNIEWTPAKCAEEKSNAGTVCRAKCLGMFNLVGRENYVCVKGRWSYYKEPTCRSNKLQAKALIKLIKKDILSEFVRSSFLFVVDNGMLPQKGTERLNYAKSLQFAKNLANTIPLGSNRRVGVELYTYKAIMMDLLENSNCYLIYTIDSVLMRSQLSRNKPNYHNAFVVAEREFINKTVMKDGGAFIFFFATRPDTSSVQKRTEITNHLKENGITIVVIMVGEEINRSQMEEMASSKYDGLQLYSFKTLKGLEDATKVLKSESKVSGGVCGREYIG